MSPRIAGGIGVAVVVAGSVALAEQAGTRQETVKASIEKSLTVAPDDMTWVEAPPVFPSGAQVALLDGRPSTPDRQFALRIRVPAGYRIMPHWHPADEHVTVISGEVRIGHGKKFARERMTSLPEGGYFVMPARHAHYLEATADTVLQLHGIGPWELHYVNPADDPRRKERPEQTTRAD